MKNNKCVEAVIVCVDYADFLSVTLPLNKHHFDRIVVVTTPEDKETQRVCRYHNVQVVASDCFRTDIGEFRKACGINEGLLHLSKDGWVVHLDADIVLPPQTRKIFRDTPLDPTMLYGIDRFRMMGAESWAKHMISPKFQHEMNVYVHTQDYPIQTRFMFPAMGGWMPVGFFQMWNPKGSGVGHYPERHSNAGRTDMLFADQWPREKRAMLAELVGYHLESESVDQGANWSGRQTKPYGVKIPWWHRLWAWARRSLRRIWKWIKHWWEHPPHPYLVEDLCPHCGAARTP